MGISSFRVGLVYRFRKADLFCQVVVVAAAASV